MKIEVTNLNGQTLIRVDEERIDAHNSPELKNRLQEILEEEAQNLILDLSPVRFIDSSGLGALLSGLKQATLRHGSLSLTGLQPRVQSMFELTRLQRVFTIFPSLDDAISPRSESITRDPTVN